jgi:hypothetical protein
VKRLKTKHFDKWAKKSHLTDFELVKASKEFENGLYAANLGGGVFKIRIAGESKGKSSGHRTILAYKKNELLIFLYGFSKNERDNISKQELGAFRKLSGDYLALSASQVERAERTGVFVLLEDKNA